jgi:hypothetical protein
MDRIVLKWEAAYAKEYCVTVTEQFTPTPTAQPAADTVVPEEKCPFARPVRRKISGTTDYSGEVAITIPEDCTADLPTGSSTAMGTYTGDLEGREIWILAYASDRKYYPQSSNACEALPAIAADGRWETGLFFGGAGERLDIVATVTDVDSEASQALKDWLRSGCDTGEFPGISKLPDELVEMDFVTIHTAEPAPEPTAPSPTATSASAAGRPEWCVPFSRPPITNAELKGTAELTFPEDCAEVEYINVVAGTSSDLPEDVHIWVLVFPQNKRFYPQSDDPVNGLRIYPAENGNWSVATYLGTPDSGREKFDLVVVLASEEASSFFSESLKKWAETMNFSGLGHGELPAGIMEVQTISVMRAQ